MSLNGKTAIVTGAGRGIGRAIAHRFAKDGANVVIVARNLDQINKVNDEIIEMGGKSIAVQTDVTNEQQVIEMVARAESEFGQIDILVNNAGVMVLKSIIYTSVEEWKSVMDTNLLGVFLCSRTVMPSMMKRRTGRIINIGSMAGRRGYPEQGVYCTSKHGLYGLSKVMAIEGHTYGIRVNVVSPGGVLTDLSESLLNSRGTSQASEWMTAEEVADGVYYIATQEGPATSDELVLRRNSSEPWR